MHRFVFYVSFLCFVRSSIVGKNAFLFLCFFVNLSAFARLFRFFFSLVSFFLDYNSIIVDVVDVAVVCARCVIQKKIIIIEKKLLPLRLFLLCVCLCVVPKKNKLHDHQWKKKER